MSKISVVQNRKMKVVMEGFLKTLHHVGVADQLVKAIISVADFDVDAMKELGRPYGFARAAQAEREARDGCPA